MNNSDFHICGLARGGLQVEWGVRDCHAPLTVDGYGRAEGIARQVAAADGKQLVTREISPWRDASMDEAEGGGTAMNWGELLFTIHKELQQDLATATDMTGFLPRQYPRAYGFLSQSVKNSLKDLEIVLAQMAADSRAMDEAEGEGRR